MSSQLKLKQQSDIVRYSPMEQVIFDLLCQRETPVSTEWLTPRLYKQLRRREPPSSRVIVTGALRSLMKKMKRNKEPFRIDRTPLSGPHSIEVRLVRHVQA